MNDSTADDESARLLTAAEVAADAADRLTERLWDAFRPFRLTLALVLVLTVLQLVGVWNLVDGRNISRANQEIIKDCTNPEGMCAKRAKAQHAAAVTDLLERMAVVQAELAACSYRQTRAEFEECKDAVVEKARTVIN